MTDEYLADEYLAMDAEVLSAFCSEELFEFPLTEPEACVLCDANNGAPILPLAWKMLDANIWDTPHAALTEKWHCDAAGLARRIAAADSGTRLALAYAVCLFWRNCNLATSDALQAAGFRIVDEVEVQAN